MRHSTCSLVIGVIGLCSLADVHANSVRKYSISCISAVTGQAVNCSHSRISPHTSVAASSGSVIEILDPTIRFEVTADLDGYDSREVEVNVASYSSRDLQLRIALAPRLEPGLYPTLATLNSARRLLDVDSTIDRGLALMEQINRIAAPTDSVGTFQVRHQYWRLVGLVKACTRLFYQTCANAAEAVTTLEQAIAENQREFARERLSKESLQGLRLSIDAANLNNTHRRANWYLELNEFSRAREEFKRARTMLASGGDTLGEQVGLTLTLLDADLALVSTRELQQTESSGSSTGPLSERQPAASARP